MFAATRQFAAGFLVVAWVMLSMPPKCTAPQLICSYECISYDGVEGVTEADYLMLLAHYGRVLSSDDPKSCLDSRLSRDYYVDIQDLLAWDTMVAGMWNGCGSGDPTIPAGAGVHATAVRVFSQGIPRNRLLISAKPNGTGQFADQLYPVDPAGCSGSPLPPAGGPGSIANGRLIRDDEGEIYQIHGVQGLIRLRDGQVMIPPPPNPVPLYNGNPVYVGIQDLGNSNFVGLPLSDVVIRVLGADVYAYVVPVLVSVPNDTPPHSYRAAAKLRITSPGQYTVEQLYGADPYHDPRVTTIPPEASPYYPYAPREIELDRSGSFVFVTSAFALNDNDWLLIFDEATGAEQTMSLTALSPSLRCPTALLASSTQDKLYLASSLNDASDTDVYRLSFSLGGPGVMLDGRVTIADCRYVTAIAERPADGCVYVVGFQSLTFPEDHRFYNGDPIFTVPKYAQVPVDVDWSAMPPATVAGGTVGCSDLALPLGAVFSPGTESDFDADGDVDLSDFSFFRSCFNGPNRPAAQTGCGDADLDSDTDVDLTDFGVFRSCFNGPNRPPACLS